MKILFFVGADYDVIYEHPLNFIQISLAIKIFQKYNIDRIMKNIMNLKF